MHAGKLLAQTPGSLSAGWGSCSQARVVCQAVKNFYIYIYMYFYIHMYIHINFKPLVLNDLYVVIFGA